MPPESPLTDAQLDAGRFVTDEDGSLFMVTDTVQGGLGPILILSEVEGDGEYVNGSVVTGDTRLVHRSTVQNHYEEAEAPEPPEGANVAPQSADIQIAELRAQIERLSQQQGSGNGNGETPKPAAKKPAARRQRAKK